MIDTPGIAKRIATTVAAAIVVGLLVAAVPAQAQSKASSQSVDSLNAVIKEVQKGRDQVKRAIDALNALIGSSENLSKNYKAFSKEVNGVTKTYKTATARVEDMNARRDAYLQEWQKKLTEVSNPEIQAHMQAREAEIKATFEGKQAAGEAIKEAFPPFLSDLQDIQKLLSLDLSADGVAAATPIAEKAVANADIILQGTDAYLAALTQIRDRVAPQSKK